VKAETLPILVTIYIEKDTFRLPCEEGSTVEFVVRNALRMFMSMHPETPNPQIERVARTNSDETPHLDIESEAHDELHHNDEIRIVLKPPVLEAFSSGKKSARDPVEDTILPEVCPPCASTSCIDVCEPEPDPKKDDDEFVDARPPFYATPRSSSPPQYQPNTQMNNRNNSELVQFKEILKDGFQIVKHHANGGMLSKKGDRLFYLDEQSDTLVCAKKRAPDVSKAEKAIPMRSVVKIDIDPSNSACFVIWYDNGQKRLMCEMSNKEIALRVAGLLGQLVSIASSNERRM
jgi:hypothetical protein